jgi:hypothetical protein
MGSMTGRLLATARRNLKEAGRPLTSGALQPRQPPKERKSIHDGGEQLVRIKIGVSANLVEHSTHVGRPYLAFERSVQKINQKDPLQGRVLFFAYCDEGDIEDFRGRTVTARYHLYLKTEQDGTQVYYCDLAIRPRDHSLFDLKVFSRRDELGAMKTEFAHQVGHGLFAVVKKAPSE